MTECDICGGSGVLHVEGIDLTKPRPEWQKYASYCHGCPAGAAWREAGLE